MSHEPQNPFSHRETCLDASCDGRCVDQEAQRRSFAYGNANIANGRVTRGIVDEEADVSESDNRWILQAGGHGAGNRLASYPPDEPAKCCALYPDCLHGRRTRVHLQGCVCAVCLSDPASHAAFIAEDL
jgi:hypothetical protein